MTGSLERLLMNQLLTLKLKHMNLAQYLTIPVFLIIALSCKTRQEASKQHKKDVPLAILADSFEDYERSAGVEIRSAVIVENILTLDVAYSGGCADHEFILVGAKMIQKSLPPKRGIMLYHNNNGDTCREQIEKTLQFDITCFAYEKGEIILVLKGYEPEISYTVH
jgi:hypothetical protein